VANDVWLVLEEANNLNPAVYASLNTLTDGSGTPLRTKDGKTYRVGDNFRVVLCFNEGAAYAGTREVNSALKDRLRPIFCPYMSASNEESLLMSRTKIDSVTANLLVSLANMCRDARKGSGFDFSPRTLFTMIEFKRELKCSWDDAFEWAALDCVGDPSEKGPQRGVLKAIAAAAGLSQWQEPTFHTV
jgi:hypothetical protein